ncbi:hypothetical protein KCP73_12085 [Salmonella enterica subsp. enterica]|nr:hypothetical protein KCP73_12085 [Salmonella enterica subsp. enterica]
MLFVTTSGYGFSLRESALRGTRFDAFSVALPGRHASPAMTALRGA